MSGFDPERVSKISQIMPQFGKVAQPGDTVLMGLEGDPLFPTDWKDSRPTAKVLGVQERANDQLVSLQMQDGTVQTVSSMSLAADQVWEFDDTSFRNVLERQRRQTDTEYRGVDNATKNDMETLQAMRNDIETLKESMAQYRGTNALQDEIKDLRLQLQAERDQTKAFHNTVIASMNEMAGDICKLDSSGKSTEFCQVLKSEYSKLLNRAEDTLYKGVAEPEVLSDDSEGDYTDVF